MNRRRFLFWVLATESALAILAMGLARLFLGRTLPWPLFVHGHDLAIGLAAAIPPAVLAECMWFPPFTRSATLRAARDRMLRKLAPVLSRPLAQIRWYEVLFIAVSAGVGEELFFRGFLQSTAGIIASALIFGLLHALTWTYFLFATAMGLYLSVLFNTTGNLTTVIVTHALYDIFALYLLRRKLHAPSP